MYRWTAYPVRVRCKMADAPRVMSPFAQAVVMSSQESIMRPLDWRRMRAKEIVDGDKPRPSDDKIILRCADFDRRRTKLVSEVDNKTKAFRREAQRLAFAYADVSNAMHYHENTDEERHGIEAALTDPKSSMAKISEELGYSSNLLTSYAALYYDIRWRLNHPGYVITTLLKRAATRTLSAQDQDVTWKLMSFMYGISTLKELWMPMVMSPDTKEKLHSLFENILLNNAAIGVMTRKFNDFNTNESTNSYIAYTARAKDAENGGSTKDELAATLQMGLAFSMHSSVEQPSALLGARKELRLSETMMKLAEHT
jgi:hypothetical protein